MGVEYDSGDSNTPKSVRDNNEKQMTQKQNMPMKKMLMIIKTRMKKKNNGNTMKRKTMGTQQQHNKPITTSITTSENDQ